MSTARQRGWGDPDAPGYRRTNIVTITAGGIRLAVHREVAPLFQSFCDEIVARGYPLNGTADDWGYANRDVRGRPGVKSNHSWGLAIDLNATTNPMTARHAEHAGKPGHDARGTHTDMPPWVIECARRHGLAWGGNYGSSRADAMHFEFLGTPADARKAVASLSASQTTPESEEDEMALYVLQAKGVTEKYVSSDLQTKVHLKSGVAVDAVLATPNAKRITLDKATLDEIPEAKTLVR